MNKPAVLVTGGAGYIGSHVVKQLGARGERLVVLDNLSTGFAESVLYGDLIIGDTGDRELVTRLLREYRVNAVMHFAAHTVVPESVVNPLKYYLNNTSHSRVLLECCQAAGVEHFIFSSTAAVYGIPEGGIATEDSPTLPINPYGTSKLMTEWMLRDLAKASSLRYVILRYFNVAGCDPEGLIGQSTPKATLLVKVACEAAVGVRPYVSIYGTDYPTPDGTGVRDYIHVMDLARAHADALDALEREGRGFTVNLGTGRGVSVLELVHAFERASGRKIPYEIVARRPGDVAAVWADPSLAHRLLGWRAELDVDAMCRDAWRWQSMNPDGYA